jgi:hypothetical protein
MTGSEQTAEFQNFRMRAFELRGHGPFLWKGNSFMVLKSRGAFELDEFKYNCHLAVGKDLWGSLHFHTDPNLF